MENLKKNKKIKSFQKQYLTNFIDQQGYTYKNICIRCKKCNRAHVIKDLKNTSMSKIPLKKLFFILICAIVLLSSTVQSKKNSVKTLEQSHETNVRFYHIENDHPLFYWISVEVMHEFAINALSTSIESVKNAIDQYKEKNSEDENQAPKLILEQNIENTSQFSQMTDSYQIKLSKMKINIMSAFLLKQLLSIRVQYNRTQLAKLVDYLQQHVFSRDENLKLTNIYAFSAQKFYENQKIKDSEVTQDQKKLIQNESVVKNIRQLAQSHCQALQMTLSQIISTKQLKINQLEDQLYQNTTQSEEQDIEQMYYNDAYNEKIDAESYQFVYRTFQVKARCTGNRALKNTSGRNQRSKNGKVQSYENVSTNELEEQIQKYKKIRIVTD